MTTALLGNTKNRSHTRKTCGTRGGSRHGPPISRTNECASRAGILKVLWEGAATGTPVLVIATVVLEDRACVVRVVATEGPFAIVQAGGRPSRVDSSHRRVDVREPAFIASPEHLTAATEPPPALPPDRPPSAPPPAPRAPPPRTPPRRRPPPPSAPPPAASEPVGPPAIRPPSLSLPPTDARTAASPATAHRPACKGRGGSRQSRGFLKRETGDN